MELEAQGKRIPAHKVVLAAASTYFRVLFTGNFKEATEKVVTLHEIDFESLSTIIECFYTRGLHLTNENIFGIYTAAHLFQIPTIIKQCETFVKNNLSKANCIVFLKLAETFNLKKVVTKATECIIKNFVTVRHTEEFKEISKDALVQYISSDLLNVGNDESEVFYAVKDWLEHRQERIQYAPEIMRTVRFKLVKIDKLNEIATTPLITNQEEIRVLVRNALSYHAKQYEKPLVNDEQCRPRGQRGLFIVDCSKSELTDFWSSSTKTEANLYPIQYGKAWNPSADKLGLFVMGSMTASQMNNFFFLFAVDQKNCTPIGKRFDASTGEWINLAPVPQKPTTGSCAARFEDQIFLFGGRYVTKRKAPLNEGKFSREAFVYNIGRNSWAQLPDVPEKICEAAATSCAIDASVYVSGGYKERVVTASQNVYAYDTKEKLWMSKPSMNHARGEHSMEAVGDKIFVFGGSETCRLASTSMVCQVEMFDVLSQQWTDIVGCYEGSLGRRVCSSALVEKGKIFIIGGSVINGNSLSSLRPTLAKFASVLVFYPKSYKLKISPIKIGRGHGFSHVSGLLTSPYLI